MLIDFKADPSKAHLNHPNRRVGLLLFYLPLAGVADCLLALSTTLLTTSCHYSLLKVRFNRLVGRSVRPQGQGQGQGKGQCEEAGQVAGLDEYHRMDEERCSGEPDTPA